MTELMHDWRIETNYFPLNFKGHFPLTGNKVCINIRCVIQVYYKIHGTQQLSSILTCIREVSGRDTGYPGLGLLVVNLRFFGQMPE